MLNSPFKPQLEASLKTVQDQFMDAFHTQSWAAFTEELTQLHRTIQESEKTAPLDNDTRSFLAGVMNNVAAMGEAVIDMQQSASSISSKMFAQYETMLAEAKLGSSSPISPPRHLKPSLQLPRHPSSTPIASALAPILPARNGSTMSVSESARSASDPNPLPEFIEHAYKFFVANIFNPYPTRDEKQAIVDKTNNTRVTLTSVSNWFTNARRRCGWADILKRCCNGNRDEMIDLATRVFVRPDAHNPVDSRIVAELMEMKESVELMYERNTRTSSWIEDLEDLDELVNPIPEEDRLAAKKRETEEEREVRKRERELLKEQREFERQKRKMQVEALRKADKVAKRMQREQEEQEKQSRKQRISSFSSLFDVVEEEEQVVEEPKLVAGGKRKVFHEDGGFEGIRNVSPASSLSSFSFMSDSSDGRVPSLTWSDSGDDERPYKRSKSSSSVPDKLAPALEIPASFNYTFNFDQSMSLTDATTAYNGIFDFSMNPAETILTTSKTSSRGQKRAHDTDESEVTPRSKRAKSAVAPIPNELIPPTPISSSIFTPTPSTSATPTQPGRRRSSYIPFDIETVLGLNNSDPEPVQMTLPDASIPLDVGVYDWSNTGMAPFEMSDVANAQPQTDFSQLLNLFSQQQQIPQIVEPQASSEQEQEQQLQLVLSNYSFSSTWTQQQSNTPAAELLETPSLDFSGLMTGFMSPEAFNDMGFEYQESVPCTPEELSRSPSASPAWAALALVTPPPEHSLSPAEVTEKALSKEKKRRELEEKKAALERERARIAEMERELEDD